LEDEEIMEYKNFAEVLLALCTVVEAFMGVEVGSGLCQSCTIKDNYLDLLFI
jgi:hypothetical protein